MTSSTRSLRTALTTARATASAGAVKPEVFIPDSSSIRCPWPALRMAPRMRTDALTGTPDLTASSPCTHKEDGARIQHRTGAPSGSVTIVPPSLLGRQVLEHQGILGRQQVAEPHMVKRKVPEERENPVVVDLRSAWQANLLDFPAACLSDGVADLPDQPVLGVGLEAGRDGEGADRAHGHVLDPAVLAHRFVRPLPDQDTGVRNRPRGVDRLVHLSEDLLLGAVVHARRNVDVGHWHAF